jgi:hypothetical protein
LNLGLLTALLTLFERFSLSRGERQLCIKPERVTLHYTGLMALANQHVLGGFTRWSEAKMVMYPDGYVDERAAIPADA